MTLFQIFDRPWNHGGVGGGIWFGKKKRRRKRSARDTSGDDDDGDLSNISFMLSKAMEKFQEDDEA